ncbi:MAG: P-loop NTPase [archaeon YNP-LCB-003-016]|jgi:ATP-binding protein involved in chromosome partitioning|uniref:P-loop NTPase n=1 Tax=Candidatus Culexarchaeum yellowstonense TaxID=2928963 RepID=UPI0026EBC567|nr:P-loop NTPase [Candidatus Culexarchaeum yellowstonense]MCR6691890.1 P-loop NTPase [Candidatus Culexarchaeum yellowstonense]
MDPRIIAINERVKSIRNVIAVVSGKGGVGKSIISTIMALQLSRMGYKVGLLDTDFTSPSTHIILNAEELTPKEDRGVIPPEIHGLKYMTITYYTKNNPTPLRGIDVSNALIEILSITRWGDLDYLIIDAPPGISDIILDLLRINWRIKFIVVATPSKLALETVRKLIKLLEEQGGDIIGIIVNMVMGIVTTEYRGLGKRVLVEIPFQQDLEDKIGDVEELLESMIGRKVEEALKLIVEESP